MTEAQIIQLPIWGGIDESVDTLRTPPGRMRTAQNVVFRSSNTTTKRYGFVPMPSVVSGIVPNRFRRIMNCNGSPVLTDGARAYGYSPSASGWIDHGPVSPCIATRKEISTGYSRGIQIDASTGAYGGQFLGFATADAAGMRLVIWQIAGSSAAGGGTYAQVTDIATGEAVSPARRLNANAPNNNVFTPNASVRALGNGTLIQVGYLDASQNLIFQQFNTATTNWSAPTTVIATTGLTFDMCLSVGSTNFFLLWFNKSASTVNLQKYNSAMGALSGSTVATLHTNDPIPVAVRAVEAERVWVAWAEQFSSTNLRVNMVTCNTSSTAVATGPFIAIAVSTPIIPLAGLDTVVGIERVDPTNVFVTLGSDSTGLEWAICSTTAQTTQNGYFFTISEAHRYVPISKPFIAPNSSVYILTLLTTKFASSLVLLELGVTNVPRAVAVLAARSAIDDFGTNLHYNACDITAPGDGTQSTFTTIGYVVNSSGAVGLTECTFDFQHPALGQSVTLGETSYICGGVLGSYDGQRVTETGFVAFPPTPTQTTTATTGGFLGANRYHYICLWRYRTNRGESERTISTAFDFLEVNLTGSGTVTNTATIHVPFLNYATTKQDPTSVGNPVFVELYRRAWIGLAESPDYYLCASVANQPLVDGYDFVDGLADATLATNPILYTAGGALEFGSPPSIRYLCSHNQRLMGIADEANVIWYTTAYVVGEKPRWNDALKLNIPGGNGTLVALASLDGRLFAFTESDAFVITGDGPNDTGAGDSWSEPVRQPFGLGCIDPRAICTTPVGIITMTRKGLYLFDRSGQTQWLGERIQRTLAAYPVITSIVHYEADGYVLVSLAQSEPAFTANVQGVTMCWDYRHDAWSTWSINTDVGTAIASVSAESIGGTYYAVFNGSIAGVHTPSITRYTPGIYRDGSGGTFGAQWITMIVEQGWLGRDLQRFDRIVRIQITGVPQGPHNLTLTKYVDFSFAVDSAVTFANADLVGDYTEHVRTELVQQKCAACLVTITDADSGDGNGASIDLEGILFKVRARRGEYKLLKTNQSG